MRHDVLALIALLSVVGASVWLRSDGDFTIVTIDARMRALQPAGSSGAAGYTLEFGGRPRIGEPQTFLYPPALGRWLPDAPLTFASYVLHAWLAGFAVYAAARSWRVARLPASGAALAFMLATSLSLPAAEMSAETLFRSAWLPLLAAAVLASSRLEGARQDGGHAWRWRQAAVVAIGVMLVTAGSVRTQAYGLIVLMSSCAVSAVWAPRPRRRVIARGALAAASILALSAPVSFPTLRFWRSMQRAGGLAASEPISGSWRSSLDWKSGISPELAGALADLRPSRVWSACPHTVDALHLRALNVPSIGGYGGVFAADYGTFVSIARGRASTATVPYVGVPEGLRGRMDLIQFLGPDYLVLCEAAGTAGELVRAIDGVRIYRTAATLSPAVWTCAPAHVGRKEIEHRLSTYRYDRTLSLYTLAPTIKVRWATDVADDARESAETRFHLWPDGPAEDRTRPYELRDMSPANIEAIVRSPLVEDTAGLDRATFVASQRRDVRFDERPTEWLVGLTSCPDTRRASLVRRDEDGLIVEVEARSAGVVLFPETFYPTRVATVDDLPAEVMKVNLAFSAVPVQPGTHRVRLGSP